MKKLSQYVRIYNDILNCQYVIYNTINRSIVALPIEAINNRGELIGLSQEEQMELEGAGFIQGTIDLNNIEKEFNSFSKLIISLELSLRCNLRCPYCYQIGKKNDRTVISSANIELLYDYIVGVYEKQQYKTLVLKILGGEPTLEWGIAHPLIKKLYCFTQKNSIHFSLMIDTNGTRIGDLLGLSEYDDLILTIPLTYKKLHDVMRYDKNGEGTYDTIVSNVSKLYSALKNTHIVLRYNTDRDNVGCFGEYVKSIKSSLTFAPIVSPSYTVDLGDGDFSNQLSYSDYVKWLSTEAIDILANNDFPIVISPYTLMEKCQYWSKYSIKVFSNGIVGACAMNFFNDDNPSLEDIINSDYKILESSWNGAKHINIFSDSKCSSCRQLFVCGGAYLLPCTQSLSIPKCQEDGNHNVILKDFISRYLKYLDEGKSDLFVGFNDYQIYR